MQFKQRREQKSRGRWLDFPRGRPPRVLWCVGTTVGVDWNKCRGERNHFDGVPDQVQGRLEQLLWLVGTSAGVSGTTAVAYRNHCGGMLDQCWGVPEQVRGELEPVLWCVGTTAVSGRHMC
jgi:hypothetical protein